MFNKAMNKITSTYNSSGVEGHAKSAWGKSKGSRIDIASAATGATIGATGDDGSALGAVGGGVLGGAGSKLARKGWASRSKAPAQIGHDSTIYM